VTGPTFTPPPGEWDKPTPQTADPAAEAAAQASTPPTPSSPASPTAEGPAPNLTRGIIAAAIAGVAALVIWSFGGWASLIVDLVFAAIVGLIYLEGWQDPSLPKLAASARRLPALGAEHLKPLAMLAAVPLVAGLLAAVAGTAHHTSQEDVCTAYQAFESSGNSTATYDNAWFDALTEVGKKAADFAGPNEDSVRDAGKAAQKLADGDGQGFIVSVNVGEAESTLAPVASLCYGE
jgi:hypothetical protein